MNDLTSASSNVGQALFGNAMRSGIGSFTSLLKTANTYTDKNTIKTGTTSEKVIATGVQVV